MKYIHVRNCFIKKNKLIKKRKKSVSVKKNVIPTNFFLHSKEEFRSRQILIHERYQKNEFLLMCLFKCGLIKGPLILGLEYFFNDIFCIRQISSYRLRKFPPNLLEIHYVKVKKKVNVTLFVRYLSIFTLTALCYNVLLTTQLHICLHYYFR